MKRVRKIYVLIFGMPLLVLVSAGAFAATSYEATSMALSDWSGWTQECMNRCGGNADDCLHEWFEDVSEYWRSGLALADDNDTSISITELSDTTIFLEELTDPSLCLAGEDDVANNVDEEDMMLIATHGGYSQESYWIPGRIDAIWFLGHQDQQCDSAAHLFGYGVNDSALCVTPTTEMLVGNSDAEFTHALACHSAEWPIVNTTDGFHAMHYKMHQYGGLHGNGQASPYTKYYIRNFAKDSFTSPVAHNWVTDLYYYYYYSYNCPVAVIQGNNTSDALARRDQERYSGKKADGTFYSDPDSTPATVYLWACGCDPDGSSHLPYCL